MDKLIFEKGVLLKAIQYLQADLGAKRMYHPDGSEYTLREFTECRKKMKHALAWRVARLRSVNSQLKKLRVDIIQPKAVKEEDQIRAAFGRLCNDVVLERVPFFDNAKELAQFYLEVNNQPGKQEK